MAQIEAAVREPISYIAIGPVFGTRTKDTGYESVGLEMVSEAARLARGLPVVAIGGITLETRTLSHRRGRGRRRRHRRPARGRNTRKLEWRRISERCAIHSGDTYNPHRLPTIDPFSAAVRRTV